MAHTAARGRGAGALSLRQAEEVGEPSDCESRNDDDTWSAWLARLYAKAWVVYCKPPFDGVDSVYAYLGRYTHRIGLSNRRLLDVTDERVTFATRHVKHT